MSGSPRGPGTAMEAAGKTAHPPLFKRHAHRPRLTRLLDDTRAQAIVVTAPAGYGKTTLAMEWLQGREDVVWYRATSASADVAAFSAGLADVVAVLVPDAGERLKQRLRVADTPERAARPLAELLAEDLAGWPEKAILVIDDYHLVADSAPVEDFFDWLLTLASQLRVLVTTRGRPRWASARRILYGEITEIGREQLAMNAEEAGRVLGDRPDESVRALVNQAEGWPALIGLAALTATHGMPRERMSEALYRYFAEEVVRSEGPDVERFMLVASLPLAVDARIARDVLGVDDPGPSLERLVDEGLLHPVGDQFRFHPLLRAFVRRKLEADDPELYRSLACQLIADARRDQRWEEAFELSVDSGRSDLALEILEAAGSEMLAEGRIETLERWLETCRTIALGHPDAHFLQSELLLRKGRLSDAAAVAEALATRLGPTDPRASKAWFLAGQALYLGSQSEAAWDFQCRANELARSEDDTKHALWGLAMTETELRLREAEGRIDALEKMAATDVDTKLRVGLGRQIVAASQGSFRGIWGIISPLTALAEHADDPMAQTTLWANAAYLCIARADYSRGVDLAKCALESCEKVRLDFAKGYCIGYLASAEIGLRRFENAARNLRGVADLATSQDNSYVRVMYAGISIRLALARGRPRQAQDVETPLADYGIPPASQGELMGLRAIAHAASGDWELGLDYARRAREVTSAVEARFYSAFADLICAIASGGDNEVVDQSAALIGEAHEADFLDALVISYRAYPPLLSTAAKGSQQALLRTILRRANDVAFARRTGVVLGSDSGLGGLNLTTRENEVMTLLSQGLTNAQIAKRLFISESTAKVHVHNILKKLGVETRLQAVLLAQDRTEA